MGPGTRVLTRLRAGIKPTSYVDALALRHDIEYMSDGEKFLSDIRAALSADNSIQGVVMRVGLLSRVAIDLLTHALPRVLDKQAPNFHLNTAAGERYISEAKALATPMLAEWDLVLD